MERPTRSKSAQRGIDKPPRLDPAKIAAKGAASQNRRRQNRPALTPISRRRHRHAHLAAPDHRCNAQSPGRVVGGAGDATDQPPAGAEPSEPRRETGKRMHIGQDISISGEITTCDVLVVDGHVDAVVRDCGRLEIGPAGTLKGDVE